MRNLPDCARGARTEVSSAVTRGETANLNAHAWATSTRVALSRTRAAEAGVADRCSFQPCCRGSWCGGVTMHQVSPSRSVHPMVEHSPRTRRVIA